MMKEVKFALTYGFFFAAVWLALDIAWWNFVEPEAVFQTKVLTVLTVSTVSNWCGAWFFKRSTK